MASMWPPKKGVAFTLYFTLYTAAGAVIANPGTITKKVSIDGGDVADIAASVTEENTTYGQCSLVLSAAEMTGDAIWVYIADDTSGCVPFTATLYTVAYTLDEMAAAIPSVATIADQVWNETSSGHTTAGTAGAQLWTDVDAILVDTGTTLDGKLNTIDDFLDTEVAAIKAKTDALDPANVTITNPVAADLTVTVTEGDDYHAAHGLQIVIPVADTGHLLGLDDPAAVVKFVCEEGEWTATSVVSTAAGYDCTFEPTAAQTVALTSDRQDWELKATLADADITTRTRGTLVRTPSVG